MLSTTPQRCVFHDVHWITPSMTLSTTPFPWHFPCRLFHDNYAIHDTVWIMFSMTLQRCAHVCVQHRFQIKITSMLMHPFYFSVITICIGLHSSVFIWLIATALFSIFGASLSLSHVGTRLLVTHAKSTLTWASQFIPAIFPTPSHYCFSTSFFYKL